MSILLVCDIDLVPRRTREEDHDGRRNSPQQDRVARRGRAPFSSGSKGLFRAIGRSGRTSHTGVRQTRTGFAVVAFRGFAWSSVRISSVQCCPGVRASCSVPDDAPLRAPDSRGFVAVARLTSSRITGRMLSIYGTRLPVSLRLDPLNFKRRVEQRTRRVAGALDLAEMIENSRLPNAARPLI